MEADNQTRSALTRIHYLGLRKYGSGTTVLVLAEVVVVEVDVDVEAVAEFLQTLAELTSVPSLEP
jgi:hypothetical protein